MERRHRFTALRKLGKHGEVELLDWLQRRVTAEQLHHLLRVDELEQAQELVADRALALRDDGNGAAHDVRSAQDQHLIELRRPAGGSLRKARLDEDP